ncbi:MAG: VWA domain-containing protein [Planctomycetota bacterium]|nr:MAG: VWA domain-containing protein [Planctomycetota bacterium]
MPSPTVVRCGAGAAGALLLASAAGALPLTPLLPPLRVAPPPAPAPDPASGTVAPRRPEPAGPRPSALASASGVRLRASLERGWTLAGERELLVHCAVHVDEPNDARDERLPVDMALVLDTSGSMAGSMDLLRQATRRLAARLGPEDRLTLVSYATTAERVFQGHPQADRAAFEAALAGLVARGGTNLSDGLDAAAAALASAAEGAASQGPRARRLVLLSDGLANQGETEPRALARRVRRLRAQGFAVSALGLGAQYDEELLGALADVGGGAYHYVARPAGLEAVVEAELRALRRLAAQDARLFLEPASGVRLLEVFSWSARTDATGWEVSLGDLERGSRRKVVARVVLPEDARPGEVLDVVRARLSFRTLPERRRAQIAPPTLRAGITQEPARAESSRNAAIADDLRRVEAARLLGEARAQALAGRVAEARRRLRELKQSVGDRLEYRDPSGALRRVDIDTLAENLEAGGTKGAEAAKLGDASARALGR